MMKYRLTYYGVCGFDYKGFNTWDDMVDWVNEQASLGLITPIESMEYNVKKDSFETIATWSKVA